MSEPIKFQCSLSNVKFTAGDENESIVSLKLPASFHPSATEIYKRGKGVVLTVTIDY